MLRVKMYHIRLKGHYLPLINDDRVAETEQIDDIGLEYDQELYVVVTYGCQNMKVAFGEVCVGFDIFMKYEMLKRDLMERDCLWKRWWVEK